MECCVDQVFKFSVKTGDEIILLTVVPHPEFIREFVFTFLYAGQVYLDRFPLTLRPQLISIIEYSLVGESSYP